MRAAGGEWLPREAPWCLQALGGLGEAGPIERVRLAVVPLVEWVEADMRVHADLRSLAAAQPWQAVGLDAFFARSQRGHTVSVGLRRVANPGLPRGNFVPLEPMPAPHPALRHIWCDYGLPPHGLESFCELVDEFRAEVSIVYVLALASAPPARAANDIRPSGGPGFGVGLFFTLRANDREGIARAQSLQARALERCAELGGKPYLWGAHQL